MGEIGGAPDAPARRETSHDTKYDSEERAYLGIARNSPLVPSRFRCPWMLLSLVSYESHPVMCIEDEISACLQRSSAHGESPQSAARARHWLLLAYCHRAGDGDTCLHPTEAQEWVVGPGCSPNLLPNNCARPAPDAVNPTLGVQRDRYVQ